MNRRNKRTAEVFLGAVNLQVTQRQYMQVIQKQNILKFCILIVWNKICNTSESTAKRSHRTQTAFVE